MNRINSFKGFSKFYENETNVSSEELIDMAKKEMPLEVVANDAAQLVDPNKSNIKDKMMQSAQAQAETEVFPEEGIKENYTGMELINPVAMDSIMKSAIARLPILTSGSRKVKFGGELVEIPSGAEYVAQGFRESGSYYIVDYKDRTGKYKPVYVDYKPTSEDLTHLKSIFEDLAKKSKWLHFIDKTVSVAGPALTILGFGLVLFGMIKWDQTSPDKWLSSGGAGEGSTPGFSWDVVAPRGGYEAAVGGGLLGVGLAGLKYSIIDKTSAAKAKEFDDCISRLASVVKAYLEPLNMGILDLINASDLHAVLNTNMAEVSGDVTKTGSTVERTSTKRMSKFKKFNS